MDAKGLSITMNYVVVALIVLIAAVTIVFNFNATMNTIQDILGTQTDANQLDLAENHCLTEKRNLCQLQGLPTGSTDWAEDARYGDQTCAEWASQGAFGGEIPGCE